MPLQYKTRNIQHLDHLHPALIANEQIILQKNAGALLMPLMDPNGPNKAIKQTIGMRSKNK